MSDSAPEDRADSVSRVVYAGLKGRCPRCEQGKLFSSFLKVAPSCSKCGLDLSGENAGDGAVPFIILLIGAIGVGLGAFLEFKFTPPIWVLVVVVFPVVIGGTLLVMQPIKGALIALQYKNRAGDTGTEHFGDN